MPRQGDSHCNNRCRAPRCKGLSKRSIYKERCCLCTRHASGLCHHHQKYDGPETTTRPPSRAATLGNGVEVKRSTITAAGNGLFAIVPFASNDYITEYDGDRINPRDVTHTMTQTHMASHGGVTISGLQQPIQGRGGGSFANDCFGQPNCNYNAIITEAENKLWLRVKSGQVIRPGQEIFVNYGRGQPVAMGERPLNFPRVRMKLGPRPN